MVKAVVVEAAWSWGRYIPGGGDGGVVWLAGGAVGGELWALSQPVVVTTQPTREAAGVFGGGRWLSLACTLAHSLTSLACHRRKATAIVMYTHGSVEYLLEAIIGSSTKICWPAVLALLHSSTVTSPQSHTRHGWLSPRIKSTPNQTNTILTPPPMTPHTPLLTHAHISLHYPSTPHPF